MKARSTFVPPAAQSIGAAPSSRNGQPGGRAGNQGPVRSQLALESRWQRKIDEIVVLSQARSGLSGEPDETPTAPGVRRSRRLGARIDAALDEVAAIEEALARLDDGSYGICVGCDRPMEAEWLIETPETQHCPDCSLRLVSWHKDTHRERRQVRRPAAACTP
jgi:DnaK suppressor protein